MPGFFVFAVEGGCVFCRTDGGGSVADQDGFRASRGLLFQALHRPQRLLLPRQANHRYSYFTTLLSSMRVLLHA